MTQPSAPVLLGVNFRSAPLSLREAMSFSAPERAGLLDAAARDQPVAEAAVLSTCNRTEFYLTGRDGRPPDEAWLTWLEAWRSQETIDAFRARAYRRTGSDAAAHLFRVASGLDSSVLGDVQIQSQVKDAMRASAKVGLLKSHLNQLMTQAIRAGRRARADTAISEGSPSIGSAVARLMYQRLDESGVKEPVIVLVGGGKAAQTIARHLGRRASGDIVFVNRTASRADALAREFGGRTASLAELSGLIMVADVLITATAASEPIVTRPMLGRRAARTRPLLVIDPSVPRNVEATDTVEVVDIDSVRDRRDADLGVREGARHAVEQIVLLEVEEWLQWSARRPVEHLIRRLYADLDRRAGPDSARVAGASTPDEAARVMRSSFRLLLHQHVRELRELVSRSHPGAAQGSDPASKDSDPDG